MNILWHLTKGRSLFISEKNKECFFGLTFWPDMIYRVRLKISHHQKCDFPVTPVLLHQTLHTCLEHFYVHSLTGKFRFEIFNWTITSWCQLEFPLRKRGGYISSQKRQRSTSTITLTIFVAETGVRCSCLAGKRCIPPGWCTGTWGDANARVAWRTLPGLHW